MKMADKLLNPKKKRKKSSWDLFTIPPRTTDIEFVEKDRIRFCINTRNKLKRLNRKQ